MYTQCVQHLVTFSFRFESNYEFSGTNMCINLATSKSSKKWIWEVLKLGLKVYFTAIRILIHNIV